MSFKSVSVSLYIAVILFVFSASFSLARGGYEVGTGKVKFDVNDDFGYLKDKPQLFTPRQNLITNSGLGVCSQSTLVNHPDGNEFVTNGGFESDATGWNVVNAAVASVSGGQSGNALEITRSGETLQYINQDVTLRVGHLYKYTAYIKSGTSGDEIFYIQIYKSGGNIYKSVSGTSSSNWTAYSITFIAPETGMSVFLMKASATPGNMLFDSISVREVVPGFVAADISAPDGWYKSVNTSLYRIQGADVLHGSYYGIKMTTSAATQALFWPAAATSTSITHLKKFAGRTVTFGAWVKSSDPVLLVMFDGYTYALQANTQSGDWEWVEKTMSVAVNTTNFRVSFQINDSGDSAYFAQPMLVYGSHIGEGNYAPIPQEVVWLNNHVPLSELNGSFSTQSGDIDVEMESAGKIPKTCNAVQISVKCRDSASSSTAPYVRLGNSSGDNYSISNNIGGVPNDDYRYYLAWVPTHGNTKLSYAIAATGSGTFDLETFVWAVQLQ